MSTKDLHCPRHPEYRSDCADCHRYRLGPAARKAIAEHVAAAPPLSDRVRELLRPLLDMSGEPHGKEVS